MSRNNGLARYLTLILLLLSAVHSNGQNIINSPYTRFGIGELNSTGFIKSTGFGGFGIGVRDPLTINLQNPASLSSLILTTYETGMNIDMRRIESSSLSENKSNLGFSYLAMAFPVIAKKWGRWPPRVSRAAI